MNNEAKTEKGADQVIIMNSPTKTMEMFSIMQNSTKKQFKLTRQIIEKNKEQLEVIKEQVVETNKDRLVKTGNELWKLKNILQKPGNLSKKLEKDCKNIARNRKTKSSKT